MNEDVWALLHHMFKRDPKVKRYVVWGILPGTIFLTRRFDSALVSDPRLRSWFPLSLRNAQGSGMRHAVGSRRYAADGGLTWDNFAAEAAAGVTLPRSCSRRSTRRVGIPSPGIRSRPR